MQLYGILQVHRNQAWAWINTPAWPVDGIIGHLQVYLEGNLREKGGLGKGLVAQGGTIAREVVENSNCIPK